MTTRRNIDWGRIRGDSDSQEQCQGPGDDRRIEEEDDRRGMMILRSETITTLKTKFSGIKRNDRGMFKAQVTNKVTDRLGELVLESVPEATTGSMFNHMQGVQRDMVATKPEIVGMDTRPSYPRQGQWSWGPPPCPCLPRCRGTW